MKTLARFVCRAAVSLGLVSVLWSCAERGPTRDDVRGRAAGESIDWSKLKKQPLRKQKQVLDVRAVSDPRLAAEIVDASEPILRYLGLLMEPSINDASSPHIRPLLRGPATVVRVPPSSVPGTRSRFLHTRIYDWKRIEPNELQFRVLYHEGAGPKHYTDDFRFIKFNAAWYFAGHVSPQPSPIETTPMDVPNFPYW